MFQSKKAFEAQGESGLKSLGLPLERSRWEWVFLSGLESVLP
jgi:hypothetical protein